MSDLIQRLREGFATNLEYEAADRIEALEKAYAQQQQVWSDAIACADRYEAALRKIGEGDVCVSLMTHPAQCGRAYQARAALGEKKDE